MLGKGLELQSVIPPRSADMQAFVMCVSLQSNIYSSAREHDQKKSGASAVALSACLSSPSSIDSEPFDLPPSVAGTGDTTLSSSSSDAPPRTLDSFGLTPPSLPPLARRSRSLSRTRSRSLSCPQFCVGGERLSRAETGKWLAVEDAVDCGW